MAQPGLPFNDAPVGLSPEQAAELMRRSYGMQLPLPPGRQPSQPGGDPGVAGAPSQPALPHGGISPTSPYPIDPETGEAIVPPEDQAAFNQPSGQGAPKPLATPQTKAPPASWTAPPQGNPLLQDIHATGSYLSQGLKDTDVPSWAKPNQFIDVIQGDGPRMRHSLGSSDPRYWAAQYPGTPENEEVSAAQRNRSALLAALHTLPDMAKLQEARLHVQSQQDLAHNQMVEKAAASAMDRTPEEQLAAIKSQTNAKQLATALRKGGPGGGPADTSQAEQQYLDSQNKVGKTLMGVPDQAERLALQKQLEQAFTADKMIAAVRGNQTALRHDPTRALIAKAIMSQGGKGTANLASELEYAILSGMSQAGKLGQGDGAAEGYEVPGLTPGSIRVSRQPTGFERMWQPVNRIDSPYRINETFKGSVPMHLTQAGRSEGLANAEVAGELLKLLREHGAFR